MLKQVNILANPSPRMQYGVCQCGTKMTRLKTTEGDPEGLRVDMSCPKCGNVYGCTKAGHTLLRAGPKGRRKQNQSADRLLIERYSSKGGKYRPAFKKVLEKVRVKLSWETMDDRQMDSLDFHEVSAWRMRQVLSEAFEAGLKLGAKNRSH